MNIAYGFIHNFTIDTQFGVLSCGKDWEMMYYFTWRLNQTLWNSSEMSQHIHC